MTRRARAMTLALAAWGFAAAAAAGRWRQGLRGDALWQWRTGLWIAAHGRVPATGLWSWGAAHTPWINLEWGFDALTGLLSRVLGPAAFGIWALVVAVGVPAALWARFRRFGTAPGWGAVLLVAAFMGCAPALAWRPQLVSFVLVPVWWGVLEAAVDRPRRLWLLVPLLWVWEQLHGSFLLGLVSLAWWIVTRAAPGAAHPWDPPTRRTLAAVLPALAVTLGLTPYGFGLVAHALWELRQPALWQAIQEWQGPNFHQAGALLFVGWPALAVGAAAWARPAAARRAGGWLWGLWALTLGMTLLAVRNLPYFGLATVSLAAAAWPRGPVRGTLAPAASAAIGCAALGWLAVQAPAWVTVRPGLPPAVVAPLRAGGRVLNSYNSGDALVALGIPTAVDGRTDLALADGLFTPALQLEAGAWPWPRTAAWFRAHRIRWVLWPTAAPGSHLLALAPGVRVAARAGGYTVFALPRAFWDAPASRRSR
jgi:hypothetical protein